MRLPTPATRVLHAQGGPTALAVIVTSVVVGLLDIGVWSAAVIAAVAVVVFSMELWADNTRKQSQIDDANTKIESLEDQATQAEAAASAADELRSTNADLEAALRGLRDQLAAPRLTLQRVLGGLGDQARLVAMIEQHRELASGGLGELLVVQIQLAGGDLGVVATAHVAHDGDHLGDQPVTLLNPAGQIASNGAVFSATETQVIARFPLDSFPQETAEVLERDGSVEPDGYRFVLWGTTLTPYLRLSDQQLADLRQALEDGANAIAEVFVAPFPDDVDEPNIEEA